MANHEKTYGICENKCKVEVYSKENADDAFAKQNDLSSYAPKNHATSQPTYGLGNRTQFGHTKVTDDFTMTAYVEGYALSAYAGYLLQRQITILQRENADTGWKTLSLNSGVSVAETGRGQVQYKKIGNHVFIRGTVAFTMGNDVFRLATLPAGYRPTKSEYSLQPCQGTRTAQVFVNNSGQLSCDYITNLSDGSKYTGAISWLQVTMDYFVD